MASSVSAWICPPSRKEIIENLVSGVGQSLLLLASPTLTHFMSPADRYNPSNVGILEDYLYHQTRSHEYDCLANLAILKLYQFNPDLYNPDVVINILIKALTVIPLPDFNLCISLLDERPHPAPSADEPDPLPALLPILHGLHQLLLQCRFPAFWALYRSPDLETLRDNYTIECRAFEDDMRDVALGAVRATFTRIGMKRLGTYLDLEGQGLEVYVRERLGWSVDGDVVSVPPNLDNHIEATVVQEQIKLPQLTKLVAHSARA